MSALTTSILSHGFFLPTGGGGGGGGDCVYAAARDVRQGVDRGDGVPGTLRIPPPEKVLVGFTYGAGGTEYGGLLQLPAPCPVPEPVHYPTARPCTPPVRPPAMVPAIRPCGCGSGEYWEQTRTVTVRCPEGKVGQSTATVTSCSAVSADHAAFLAVALARQKAETGLSTECGWQATATAAGVCGHEETGTGFSTVSYMEAYSIALAAATLAANEWCVDNTVTYVSTQSATRTVECPDGTCGDPSEATAEGTAYSTVSQEDADDQATAQAIINAQAQAALGLDCSHTPFTASRTVTVNCPSGTSGSPSTFSATVTRCVESDAITEAEAEALAGAEAGLSCTEIVYTSTQSATASCPEGYTGNPVTATATRESSVSQEDADSLASDDAAAAAAALLVCNPVVYYGTAVANFTCWDESVKTGYGTGTSTVSQMQADADALADAEANAQSQCPPEE